MDMSYYRTVGFVCVYIVIFFTVHEYIRNWHGFLYEDM